MTDTKKPDLILAQLDVEEAGPYVVGLSGGKRVTFPDPGSMNAFEADEFSRDLIQAQSADEVFSRWLSEADVKKLKAEKGFNLYRMRKLMKELRTHYEVAFGDMGEDNAS